MKVPSNAKAVCPECDRQVKAFAHRGRLIYEFHPKPGKKLPDNPANRCEASGWLVEDNELVKETA